MITITSSTTFWEFNMNKPISPDEIAEAKRKAIPEYVFEAVNDILARKFTAGSCSFKQNQLMDEVLKRGPEGLTRSQVFEAGYLNIEEAYRNVGWKVKYDKPAYYEDYDAYFEFKKAPNNVDQY